MHFKNNLMVVFLVAIVTLNLAWEHQTILIPMVQLKAYYHLAAQEPFVYRILPALVYYWIAPGHIELTGLNDPFESTASIFQLLLDAISLSCALFFMYRIVRLLNPSIASGVCLVFAAAAWLIIVIFGYYMVPNRALFYPYDFPDLCFATIIFYLCIRLQGNHEYLLPLAVFVATLNKETAIFYIGLYVVLRASAAAASWTRASSVILLSALSFVAARSLVMWLVKTLGAGPPTQGMQYELHLAYTLEQLKNPLFVFAMLNICSYLYVGVFLLRRKLQRVDYLILMMVAGWMVIMSMVGIVRELRIFVPASLMMFVIIARHLDTVLRTLPRAAAQTSTDDTTRHPGAVPAVAITKASYEENTMGGLRT